MKIKRGSTFILQGRLLISGEPINITDYQIKSQVRRGLDLVANLDINKISGTQFQLQADTSSWPVASLKGDIKYTAPNGQVVYTDTFHVNIEERITE